VKGRPDTPRYFSFFIKVTLRAFNFYENSCTLQLNFFALPVCSCNYYSAESIDWYWPQMTEFRKSKLAKAREIRDLGNYGKALALFYEVETELTDLALATEISGLLLEQGSVERAHEKIRNALETMIEGQEAIVIAMAEVVRAVTSTFMTGIFSGALKDVSSLYAKYLADSAAPYYTKNMVSQWIYSL
jgi:hypothetical protein